MVEGLLWVRCNDALDLQRDLLPLTRKTIPAWWRLMLSPLLIKQTLAAAGPQVSGVLMSWFQRWLKHHSPVWI